MTSDAPLYKNQVLLLSQTFFIKDNQAELLMCAHKWLRNHLEGMNKTTLRGNSSSD